MRAGAFLIGIGFIATLMGCGAHYAASPDAGGSAPDSGGSIDAGSGCDGVAPAHLEDFFQDVLAGSAPTGCTASACHGGGQGNLTFKSAHDLWAATVNVASSEQPSVLRVKPGDANHSFLFQRISGTVAPQMPNGGPYLSAQQLAQVAGWICAGAPEPAQVRIDSLLPASGVIGAPVRIVGAGFDPDAGNDAVVFGGGATATITSASATELDVTVPSGAVTGPVTVAVGTLTAASPTDFTVTTTNPVPTLTAVAPSPLSAAVDQTITLTGTGFVGGSVAQLGSTSLVTQYQSDTTLTAALPASAVPTAASYSVTVLNPAPGGGSSTPFTVTAQNPVPAITALSPASITAGAGDTVVTVSGTGFLSSSQVSFDSVQLTPTFSAGTLTVTVPAGELAVGATHSLTVTNGSPGGGASQPAQFTVNNPVPSVASISPSAIPTNGAPVTLTVTGSGFNSASVVELGDGGLPTTFVSTTSLTAQVPTIATDGSYAITVVNPAPGGGASAPATLTAATSAGPTITGLSPNPGPAGQVFALTLTGAGFVCGSGASTVSFNGANIAVSSCSTTTLTASVPATSAGSYPVVVSNGSTASNSVSLALQTPNPAPTLTSISPTSAIVGAASATLTANGSNFINGSQIVFNGSARTTTFVNASQLTTQLSSSDLATIGTYTVAVSTPSPGGGTSSSQSFDVIAVPAPVLTSISPTSATAGTAVTLTANGSSFVSTSQIEVNGVAVSTTFVSSTTLTAALTTTDLATAGTYNIDVTTPSAGTSAALQLQVTNPSPTLSSLSPSTIAVGASSPKVTLNGSGFVSTSTAQLDGAARTTTFINATQLTVALNSSDVSAAGTHTLTVNNPTPGGGTSNGLTLTIEVQNPVPSISTLSPCGAVANSGSFALTIAGAGFVSGATVSFNGSTLTPTNVTTSSITVTVPNISSAPTDDAATVVVTNPSPGGGASNSATFGVASAAQTLTNIQNTIFTPSCATSGCHTTGSHSVPMSLQSGAAYGNLVGVTSSGCAPELRVLACGPLTTQSVLIDKLTLVTPCSGSQMPKGASLQASQIQMIRDWVAEGAPNN